MALTERQKQIKTLQREGKKADEIAAELGITANAVYQQLRRMKTGGGASKPAAKTAAKAKPAAAAPKAAPRARAATPLTPEKALKVERDGIAAELKVTAAELESARKTLEKAEAAHAAALDGKRERVNQIDTAITALTGERPEALAGFEVHATTAAGPVSPAAEPTPEPEATSEPTPAAATADEPQASTQPVGEAKPAPKAAANGRSTSKTAAKSAAKAKPAAKAAPAKPAATTPTPTSQAEREATADDLTAEAKAQEQSGEPEREPVAA